jgi:hypothetical protein
MAAFKATRLVCSAIASMVCTIVPIWRLDSPRPSITRADSATVDRMRCIPATVWLTAAAPVVVMR